VGAARKLARIETDTRIASIPNKNQWRTAHGHIWTAKLVCPLRHNNEIAVYRGGERAAREEVSLQEAAHLLGVTATRVLRLIGLKRLPALQVCTKAVWILSRAGVERRLADRLIAKAPPRVASEQPLPETP